jgi:hypothetical protein
MRLVIFPGGEPKRTAVYHCHSRCAVDFDFIVRGN